MIWEGFKFQIFGGVQMMKHQIFTPVPGIRGWNYFACKYAKGYSRCFGKKWSDLNSTGTWKWISWSSGTQKCGSFCNWAPHDDFRGVQSFRFWRVKVTKWQGVTSYPGITGQNLFAHGVICFCSECCFVVFFAPLNTKATRILQLALRSESPGPKQHKNAVGSAIELLMMISEGLKSFIFWGVQLTKQFHRCSRDWRPGSQHMQTPLGVFYKLHTGSVGSAQRAFLAPQNTKAWIQLHFSVPLDQEIHWQEAVEEFKSHQFLPKHLGDTQSPRETEGQETSHTKRGSMQQAGFTRSKKT